MFCDDLDNKVKINQGPYLYDVHTEGEGGLKNCLILRTKSTDRLREMRIKGGRGVKNPKNVADVI